MNSIANAAALIRDIDPALAAVFLSQPFHRRTAVQALHQGMSRSNVYAALADKVAVTLHSVLDQEDRTASLLAISTEGKQA
ncbi:hypothetical protein [Dyella sp.]|uniref:hypothetical protein n=1 Tax=Dyella sp. TaxID=1869338 RepID=UPI002FD98139